jgi:hypothetical protein
MLSSQFTLAILQIPVYFSQVAEAGGAKKLSVYGTNRMFQAEDVIPAFSEKFHSLVYFRRNK